MFSGIHDSMCHLEAFVMTTQSSKLVGLELSHPFTPQHFPGWTLCVLHIACDRERVLCPGAVFGMESRCLHAPGETDETSCRRWEPLHVLCAPVGALEPGVGLVTFGTGCPCELEVKHAGFLPRTESLPSFEMQRPFRRVCE